MQCKDCSVCVQGWFRRQPDAFVCVSAKPPFVIQDINKECELDNKVKEKKECEN